MLYIFYMSKIMPIITELWNNTISPYKNWHKQIKWFSIFIKPNKCQKKIEKGIKKKGNLTCAYLGLSPAQPSSSRPAQPGGGPAHLAPPPLSSSFPTGERSVAGARARHRATPPPSLPACPPLAALDGPHVATQPPRSFSPPSRSSPPLAPPHSHRTRPPPPTRTTTATGLPSPP